LDWNAIGAISDVISAVAVVITLVYLASQLRENTKALRGSSAESALAAVLEFTGDMARDDELNRLFTRGTEDWDGLTDSDRARLAYMLFRLFKIMENIHYYRTLGTLDEQSWVGWEALIAHYTQSPAGQIYLKARRSWYSDRFVTFVDSLRGRDVRLPTKDLMTLVKETGASAPTSDKV
jgi:hypothetical protein